MLAAFGIARGARRVCGSTLHGSTRSFRTHAHAYAASPGSEVGDGASGASRVPSTVVRGTYSGVIVAYTVTHGDTTRGYPEMTLSEMCDALDLRYREKRAPGERHLLQVIDKVKTTDDATRAARAVARFHSEKTFLAASDEGWGLSEGSMNQESTINKPGKRGGLHPNGLLMFIEKSAGVGNVDAAIAAAVNHNVMGFKVTKLACEKLLEVCETSAQAMKVYELWRGVGGANSVDSDFAAKVVTAAARVGDKSAARQWAETFQASGVDVDLGGIELTEENSETEDTGTMDEELTTDTDETEEVEEEQTK